MGRDSGRIQLPHVVDFGVDIFVLLLLLLLLLSSSKNQKKKPLILMITINSRVLGLQTLFAAVDN
jgi:hypothetical protein